MKTVSTAAPRQGEISLSSVKAADTELRRSLDALHKFLETNPNGAELKKLHVALSQGAAALRGALPSAEEDLTAKYQFKVRPDGLVEITLPPKARIAGIFNEVSQQCKKAGRAGVSKAARDFFSNFAVANEERRFSFRFSKTLMGKCFLDCDISNANLAPTAVIAAAAALHYAQTGKDLFEGLRAQGADPRVVLRTGAQGVHINYVFTGQHYNDVIRAEMAR